MKTRVLLLLFIFFFTKEVTAQEVCYEVRKVLQTYHVYNGDRYIRSYEKVEEREFQVPCQRQTYRSQQQVPLSHTPQGNQRPRRNTNLSFNLNLLPNTGWNQPLVGFGLGHRRNIGWNQPIFGLGGRRSYSTFTNLANPITAAYHFGGGTPRAVQYIAW